MRELLTDFDLVSGIEFDLYLLRIGIIHAALVRHIGSIHQCNSYSCLLHTIVAAIVRVMCGMVANEVAAGNIEVINDAKRIQGIASSSVTLSNARTLVSDAGVSADEYRVIPEQLCASILHTVYMGTGNSSAATKSRSLRLAQAIGAYHNSINIDAIVSAVLCVFTTLSTTCTAQAAQSSEVQVIQFE